MDEVPNKTSSMYIYNVHTTLLNVTKIYDLEDQTGQKQAQLLGPVSSKDLTSLEQLWQQNVAPLTEGEINDVGIICSLA